VEAQPGTGGTEAEMGVGARTEVGMEAETGVAMEAEMGAQAGAWVEAEAEPDPEADPETEAEAGAGVGGGALATTEQPVGGVGCSLTSVGKWPPTRLAPPARKSRHSGACRSARTAPPAANPSDVGIAPFGVEIAYRRDASGGVAALEFVPRQVGE